VWLDEPLADEIIDGDDWFERWMSHRSAAALDAAAMLIRSRGGDALERAEFARLFATGEPAEGLAAFLAKRRPSFTLRNGRTS
jgi:enoyl-CoA hydratase/carnithine racemase